jgi:hypothetical protein
MNGTLTCDDCGAPMKEYDIYDKDTHETVDTHHVCPNKWKMTHP